MTGTRRVAAAAAIAMSAGLAGCASAPQLEAQWIDPQLGAHSGWLRGATVLVACDAYDLAIRQICQDQLAAEVVARGATPVFAAADTPILTDRAVDGQLLPGARSVGAKAVLVVTLVAAQTGERSGFAVGIGSFGFGRNPAVGVGVMTPIGSAHAQIGYSANGRITDAASGRLLWTARANAAPSGDLSVQLGQLAKAVLDSADKAGLF